MGLSALLLRNDGPTFARRRGGHTQRLLHGERPHVHASNVRWPSNVCRRSAAVHSWLCRLRYPRADRKSTRLNSSHVSISYAVFCLKKKKTHKHSILNNKKNNRKKVKQ